MIAAATLQVAAEEKYTSKYNDFYDRWEFSTIK